MTVERKSTIAENYLEQRPLALIFAANQKFLPGFAVALGSVMVTSSLDRFSVYLLHDAAESVDELISAGRSICERFGFPSAHFHAVPIDLNAFAGCAEYAGNHLPYARIYALQHLKESILIYLDSDMIVLSDIAEVLTEVPENVQCAAVHDPVVRTHADDGYMLDSEVNSDAADYFNSGLLVLKNTEELRLRLFNGFERLKGRLENPSFGDQSYMKTQESSRKIVPLF